MLKKDITYTNFDGESVTETFHFHLSQTELLEMEMATKGGLQAHMEQLVEAKDGGAIMRTIQEFLLKAVGKKSPDGSRFVKNQEITDDFRFSPAYDTFFMELCTNPDQAATFLNGIVPAELAQNVERLSKLEQVKASAEARGQVRPAVEAVSDPAQGGNVFEQTDQDNPQAGPRVLSPAEAREMDHDELTSGLATGKYQLGKE